MTLKRKPFENFVGKGENDGIQHFLLFPAMFSTHSKKNFCFKSTVILSSKNVFNLEQSKNLLFGKELNLKSPFTTTVVFAASTDQDHAAQNRQLDL